MKGKLQIMDPSGHKTLDWDTEDKTKLSPEEVNREFDRLVEGGHLAFTERDGEMVQTKTFDPEQDKKTLLVPPFVGG